jgi:O-antigen ligase
MALSGKRHNGYMDLWLGVGIVGPLLLVISVGLNLKNAATWLRSGSGSDARWCVVFLVMLMMSNLNESDFLEQNSVLMILYVTTTIYAQRATQRRRPAPALVSAKAPLHLHPSTSRG